MHSDEERARRLRWRCRRGLRELDALLAGYWRLPVGTFQAHHQRAFERLLERSDPALLAALMDESPGDEDAATGYVIRCLRNAARAEA